MQEEERGAAAAEAKEMEEEEKRGKEIESNMRERCEEERAQ